MNKTLGHLIAATACLAGLGAAPAAHAYTFATADCSINTNGWCLGGSLMSGYLGAITNPANFGASGTVHTAINVNQLSTVTSTTLAGANGFISPWWLDGESAAYTAALKTFFLSGGDLILLQDDTGHDGIGEALGIPTGGNSDGSNSNGASPLFVGPFGVATNVSQAGTTGFLTAATILATHGTIGGVNASGQITSAYWAEGQFAPGSGALVIIADVDMFSSAYGNVSYSPLNANGIFALNSTAFAIAPAAVPEPAVWSMMLLGAGAIGAVRRRGKRTALAKA